MRDLPAGAVIANIVNDKYSEFELRRIISYAQLQLHKKANAVDPEAERRRDAFSVESILGMNVTTT